MSYVLECQLTAPVSIQEAFAVFENPYNLAKITPAWLNFRITSPQQVQIRKGAEITYQIRWAGVPLSWKTIITEYEPPFYFVDEQAQGPYKFWRHRHSFHPAENGTIVSDRVEYALPLGPAGWIAHKLLVARQLREIFAYRQKTLAFLLAEGRHGEVSWTSPVTFCQSGSS